MINIISNANVYLKEGSLVGKTEEVTLPSLKMKMQEIKALGLFGSSEVAVGLEAMEMKLKWNSLYDKHLFALHPFRALPIVVKSNMQTVDGFGVTANSTVTLSIVGTFKELPLGSIKPGEKQDGLEMVMSVSYYKLEINGITVQEVDVYNNIFKIGEEDILLPFKINQ